MTKQRADKYETKLVTNLTFDELMKLTVSDKKEEKDNKEGLRDRDDKSDRK